MHHSANLSNLPYLCNRICKKIKRELDKSFVTPSLPGGFTCKFRIFAPLRNFLTRHSIVLEGCSNTQKTWRVFQFTMKEKFWVSGFL